MGAGKSNDYIEKISKARTFCSINELIHLKERDLIKGADLNSGIVFLDNSINQKTINEILLNINIKATSIKNNNYTLNNIPLRYKNEPIDIKY